MKIIELTLGENELEDGVQAISVVSAPAIKKNFITLKDEKGEMKALDPKKVQFQTENEEQQILLGPAMIPNMMIYREDKKTGEPYYNYFSPSTIKKVAMLFMKGGRQNAATIEHDFAVNDFTAFESWIVENPEKDKSALYFDAGAIPVGTWMVSMKVHSDRIWNDFIKSGDLRGFSIEGFFTDGFQGNSEDKAAERIASALKEYHNTLLRVRAFQKK